MVSINYSAREVCCKIVYYGPGLSGKTTNLQYVHSKVPGNTRGKLISLATEADRTLYFDFLPLNIGTINGFTAKFQLYTVPGQVYYNATRKLVLRGVDGVVFVADSQPDKMDENIESLTNLEENLREYGYDLDSLPIVIQYNKRDLPGVLPVETLNSQLNTRGWRHFEASATVGNGVFDTLKLIIKLVLDKAKKSSGPKVAASAPTAMPNPESPSASPAAGETMERMPAQSELDSSESPEPQPVSVSAPQESGEVTRPAYRPYPGSETRGRTETSQKKISQAAFTSSSEDEISPSSLGENMPSRRAGTGESNGGRPHMAPPLKRRPEKKRGFFKRSFGLK